jgi:hypothetical protein
MSSAHTDSMFAPEWTASLPVEPDEGETGTPAFLDPKSIPPPSPYPKPFHEAWSNAKQWPARTLVEQELMRLSRAIRSKPSWKTKYKDATITAKWLAELALQNVEEPAAKLSYVLKELAFYEAQTLQLEGASPATVEMGLVEGTFLSDDLIPEPLKQELLAGMAEFEAAVPEGSIDYHPGSKDQVIDWVHPSLYCLVYSRTRVIDGPAEPVDIHDSAWLDGILGTGNPIGNRAPVGVNAIYEDRVQKYRPRKHYAESMKTQWIPTDFWVSSDEADSTLAHGLAPPISRVFPASVEIRSYINNLHPVQFKGLYDVSLSKEAQSTTANIKLAPGHCQDFCSFRPTL